MKLVKENDKYIFECTYQERFTAKEAKLRWDKNRKVWWTDEVNKAVKLSAYATDEALATLVTDSESFNATLNESMASDSNLVIPKPENLSDNYLPFQKAGIEYGSKRKNVLIADEMGLGKTIQAIGILNLTENLKSVLVIVPASLKLNWKKEIEKWLVPNLTIGVATSKDGIPRTDIVIINYDILKKYKERLLKSWDVVIIDECHYIKNAKTQRSKLVLEIGSLADQRILLTGTPIVNRPKELWNIVSFLAPEKFNNFWGFHKYYCDAHHNGYGYDFDGAKNLDELQILLRQLIMVRRLKKDILIELPAKLRQIIEIPLNGFASVVRNEREMRLQSEEVVEEMKRKLEELKENKDDFDPAAYDEAVKELKSERSYAFAEIAKARHETALAKVPVVIDYIKEVLENDKKVVVFAHHRDVIEAIQESLGSKAVILYGGMNEIKKEESVTRFQNDENVKVFVGSIQAAGVGITLTAASHVIFAELDWVPGNLSQAEDRCHRIGQTDSVLVQHIVLEDSIDSLLAQTIVEKQEVIDEAMNKDQRIEVSNIEENTQMSDSVIDVASVQNIERVENVTPEAIFTDDQKANIHLAIQTVQGYCDGARAQDGMGFNRLDVAFGKSLAGKVQLTERQAIAGLRMVWKYRRQLNEGIVENLESCVTIAKRAKEEGRI